MSMTLTTAEPIATPPAVAIICPIWNCRKWDFHSENKIPLVDIPSQVLAKQPVHQQLMVELPLVPVEQHELLVVVEKNGMAVEPDGMRLTLVYRKRKRFKLIKCSTIMRHCHWRLTSHLFIVYTKDTENIPRANWVTIHISQQTSKLLSNASHDHSRWVIGKLFAISSLQQQIYHSTVVCCIVFKVMSKSIELYNQNAWIYCFTSFSQFISTKKTSIAIASQINCKSIHLTMTRFAMQSFATYCEMATYRRPTGGGLAERPRRAIVYLIWFFYFSENWNLEKKK